MSKVIDFTGQKFGKLTVTRIAATSSGKSSWWVKCDCGNICTVFADNLKNGFTKSCGCIKSEKKRVAIAKRIRNGKIWDTFINKRKFKKFD